MMNFLHLPTAVCVRMHVYVRVLCTCVYGGVCCLITSFFPLNVHLWIGWGWQGDRESS